MRVLSRSPFRSFSLARSRQACRDSVWVHLVLSGRYGNLDHPLLPSRHPPSSSLCYPGPLKLSPRLYLAHFLFLRLLPSPLPARLPLSLPPPRPFLPPPAFAELTLSLSHARALFPSLLGRLV